MAGDLAELCGPETGLLHLVKSRPPTRRSGHPGRSRWAWSLLEVSALGPTPAWGLKSRSIALVHGFTAAQDRPRRRTKGREDELARAVRAESLLRRVHRHPRR